MNNQAMMNEVAMSVKVIREGKGTLFRFISKAVKEIYHVDYGTYPRW
jgi:hypothetical protein